MFDDLIADSNNLRIVVFGSRLYGTNKDNSDWDLLIIQKIKRPIKDINIHCFTIDEYKLSIINGDIVALETYFAPKEFVLKDEWYETDLLLTLNKESFRRNISILSENSFVKCKKKLIVVGDYDLDTAIKSMFHSFRILAFAKQVLLYNEITDFQAMNWLYKELVFLSYDLGRNKLWELIDDRYRGLYNKTRSEFKQLCPITKIKNKHDLLLKTLKAHGVYSDELFEDLKKIF